MNRSRRIESVCGALFVALLLAASSASAQDSTNPAPLPEAAHDGVQGLLGVALRGSNEGAGLGLDARVRLPRGTQLGAILASDYLETAHVGGFVTHGAATGELRLLALVPLVVSPRVELDLRVSTGLRFIRDVGSPTTNGADAMRSSTEFALLAHVAIGERLLLRAGATFVLELEVQPTVALADQMQLLTLGLGSTFGERTLLYGTVDAGGTYGFDGDNGKVVVRGELGLRIALGRGANARAPF